MPLNYLEHLTRQARTVAFKLVIVDGPFQARWRQRAADTSRDIGLDAIHSEKYKKCQPLEQALSEYSGVGVKAEMKGWHGQRAERARFIHRGRFISCIKGPLCLIKGVRGHNSLHYRRGV